MRRILISNFVDSMKHCELLHYSCTNETRISCHYTLWSLAIFCVSPEIKPAKIDRGVLAKIKFSVTRQVR